MKSGLISLLLVFLWSPVGADAAGDRARPKGPGPRDGAGPPASRPAAVDEQDDGEPAVPPPGSRHDWWPRRAWGDRDEMPGPVDRFRFRQGPGGPPWQDDDGQMTPEQEARLMDFAREHFPQLHQRLLAVRKNDPSLFRQMIRRARGPISEIVRVKERDPEAAAKLIEAHRIEIELTGLRGQYESAVDNRQREQIRSRMRELVAKRNELRLERLKEEVRDLERRLEQAKGEMARREKNKDQIIEQEMKKLLSHGPLAPEGELPPKPPGPRGPKRMPGQPAPPAADTPAPPE